MKFQQAILPSHSLPVSSLVFLFNKDGEIALSDGQIPRRISDRAELELAVYLGTYETVPCYAVRAKSDSAEYAFEEIRRLHSILPDDLYALIGYASQILTWQENYQFCSRCGAKAEPSESERTMVCPECNLMNYPRISPSMIVAVIKGDQLLMARGYHFPPGIYSVVAGFLEPGETVEECVVREVMEETGLEIKNIRYVTSQPWPFPHSIMIGFTADYAGGELNIDRNELEDAGWYSANNLPKIPSKDTIARTLIEGYLARHSD